MTTCAKCHKASDSYFKIERVGTDGKTAASVNVCCLVCLVGWAHDYAVTSGMKLAIATQAAVQQGKAALGGLIKAIKGS